MSTSDLFRCAKFMWIFMSATVVLSQDSPIKKCLKGVEDNQTLSVTLTCPPGMVISVGDAFFGRNKWGLCTYTAGDCKVAVNSFESCNGQQDCTRTFNSIYTIECGFATFLRVMYDCGVGTVPVPGRTPDPGAGHRSTPSPARPPVVRVSNWEPVVVPQNNPDTALIAGCAVAVVVTLTILIIAIVFVVRRLTGVRDDGSPNAKKGTPISVLICTKLGCALAQCREPDPEEGGEPETDTETGPMGQDTEDESRVSPIGADAVEDVQELGRTDDDVTGVPAAGQADVTVYRTDVPVQGHVSSRGGPSRVGRTVPVERSRDETLPRDLRARSEPSSRNFSSSPGSSSRRSENASLRIDFNSEPSLDAIIIPNTELSTLC